MNAKNEALGKVSGECYYSPPMTELIQTGS